MRSFKSIALALVLGATLTTTVQARRTEGPMNATITVPAGQSVYYALQFNANEPAIVNVRGTGRSMMQVNIYDADGNVAVGEGAWDRVSASMDVYRAGYFRVEIVNIGPQDNVVVVTTN